jgi:Zn-dependent protease
MRVKVSRGAVILVIGSAVLGMAETWRRGWDLIGLWEGSRPWLIVAAAALVHELGHIAAARWVGVGIRGMKLDLFGARLELGGLLSYGREFWIAAGGPLAGLLSVAVLYPLNTLRGREGIELFLGASLVLGCVNLLPVGTLDGGRMLRSAVAWMAGDRAAEGVLRWTTGLCLGMLWLLAAYALLRRGELLSVFAFSLCLLFRTLGGEEGM